MKPYNHGDYCLLTSLYCYATEGNELWMEAMEKECKLSPLSLFPRKSEEYTWSRSDGLTRWIYDKILCHFNIDPHKGLNGDQLRAYYLYLLKTKQRRKAWMHIGGFVLRLGFFPSMMEHVIWKPQSIICLLAAAWRPLRFLVYPFFRYSVERNLEEDILDGTTNKITLLPTLKELGYLEVCRKLYESVLYINIGSYHVAYTNSWSDRVYRTYFCQDDNRFIGESLMEVFK